MKNHLFVADSGEIFDTRIVDWSKKPLRKVYSRHFTQIENTTQLKACLRAGQYTGMGGYPLYFVTTDGGALSFESVLANLALCIDSIKKQYNDGWQICACEVNYESELFCDHSGEPIKSAY